MLLIPSIDLRAGRGVRLLRGSFDHQTEYAPDPVETVRSFCAAGARWVHVVDLDAAEGKGADNLDLIRRIRGAVSCRLQVGGGVRTEEQARRLLDLGVDRLVLGTVLVKAPARAREWVDRLGPRFAAGLDAYDGRVRVAGWAEEAGGADTLVAAGLAALGMRWLIYTSISQDGTLAGPDIPRTNAAARAAGLPTVVSGGIGSEDDVDAVAGRGDPLVAGVILGRALYEGRVDLGRLLRRFPQEDPTAWDP
jgi:phosphoribosylformimino-5-aminoimidazole carboxamide ribotide isomerase